MGTHLDKDGQFQSDKYPTCPPGKVPLSVKDPAAQDLLWTYAQRRRVVDAEFSADLETALKAAGFTPPADPLKLREALEAARRIESERYIGSQFVTDARKVARALLAQGRDEVVEMCAVIADDAERATAVMLREQLAGTPDYLRSRGAESCANMIGRYIRALKHEASDEGKAP